MPGMAGIPDSARARPGSPGAWGSRRARPGSTSGWRARSARCRCCRTRSPAASCPTPRSGLTRVATPETEERLLAVGRAGTAEHVERIGRGWRRMDRKAEAREAARQHAGRALHVYPDEDGTVRIRGRLAPEVGALLMQALAAAREAVYPKNVPAGTCAPGVSQETPTLGQQQADALALLAETALHHGIDPGAPGERYQVVVHVDAAVLADADQAGQSVLEAGLRVPAGTSQRLACDASRVVMRHDADGRLLEVGARTRPIPPAWRPGLHHRDRGCRFPGCGVRFGQGHHLRHWAHGGPTTLSNLALLCRRHHRAVHEEGFQVARGPDGVLQFRRPNGHPLPEVPAPAAVPGDPVKALHESHDTQGLRVTARTGCPSWLGEGLNVGWGSMSCTDSPRDRDRVRPNQDRWPVTPAIPSAGS